MQRFEGQKASQQGAQRLASRSYSLENCAVTKYSGHRRLKISGSWSMIYDELRGEYSSVSWSREDRDHDRKLTTPESTDKGNTVIKSKSRRWFNPF